MSSARLEENKQTVLAFYQAAINDKDHNAASKLLNRGYIQHNPRIADGLEGFRGFVETLKADFPHLRAEVKRIFAEGDHVIAHVHGVRVPGGPGTAIVDYLPPGGRPDRRTLGRHAADPRPGAQPERHVLSGESPRSGDLATFRA